MTRPGASTPFDANTDRSQPCGASAAGKAPVSRREPPAAAPRAFGALLAAHLPLRRILFALGLGFFVAGLLLPLEGYRELLVFATAYLLWGGDVLLRAARNITRGRVFDENFLMSIATLGAFAIGEYPEGVAVMIFYQVGEMLQGHAVNRSRRSIRELMDIRPDYAHLQGPEGTRTVAPEAVQVGDVIVVRPGEKVPLDGEVRAGTSSLDLSALTGESLPQEVQPGDAVLSGAVNSTGLLHLEVTRAYRDSTVSRILALVEGAEARKAKTERFITRFARYYTPGVVAGAALLALLPPLLLPGEDFATWVYRALVFLVISCPCALLISIPLGFFGGIGGASRRGILVKGGNVLEGLSRIDTVIFDKTGTLTEGVFQVREILPWDGLKQAELLAYGAAAARHSSHPVSASLLRAWEALREPGAAVSAGEVAGFAQLDGSTGFTGPHEPGEPDEPHGPDQPHGPGEPGGLHRPAGSLEETGRFADRFQEMPGRGVLLETPRGKVLMGSARFLEEEGLTLPPGAEAANGGQTRVHLALNGQYAGQITFSDRVRPDAANAVARLRQLGVRQVLMLTGDKQAAAEETARLVGVDQVRAELLPHQKIAILEELEAFRNGGNDGNGESGRIPHRPRSRGRGGKPRGRIAFVGDGINDAPALARADIGVAIGGVGSDAALEAADVVLMTGEPSKLVEAITIARKTGRIVRQNVVFALGTKALILLLGVAGIATMWGAVFADVGVALLAVLNAMRAMR